MSGALTVESFGPNYRNPHKPNFAGTMSDFDRRSDHDGEAEYSRKRESNNTPPGGIPGVKYAEPFVPQYTSYPGYTSTATGSTHGPQPSRAPPPAGSYQYSQLPHGLQYSAKPVIPKPRIPVNDYQDRSSKYDDLEKYRSRSPDSDDDKRRPSKSKAYEGLDKYRSMDQDSDDDKRGPSKSKAHDGLDKYRSRDQDSDEEKLSRKSTYEELQKYRSRDLDSDDQKRATKSTRFEENDSYVSRRQDSDEDLQYSKKLDKRTEDIDTYRSSRLNLEDDERRYSKKDDKYTEVDQYRSEELDSDEEDRGKNYGIKPRHPLRRDSDRDDRNPYDSKSHSSSAPYPTGPDMFFGMHPPPPPPGGSYRDSESRLRSNSSVQGSVSYKNGQKITELVPRDKSPSPPRKSRHLSVGDDRSGLRAPSPGELRPGMGRLFVSGDRPDIRAGGGMPPPSPLLEAYRGTWQSMPGMPSPMAYPRDYDDDLDDVEDLEPLEHHQSNSNQRSRKSSSAVYKNGKRDYEDLDEIDELENVDPRRSNSSFKLDGRKSGVSLYKKTIDKRRDSSGSRSDEEIVSRKESVKSKKSVSLYAADQDARDIAKQLLSRNEPNFAILTEILPHLSHDQILELHTAYKRVAKQNGKGINLAKHIKLKAKGNYGTIAYVTALGRWESEGYWANYWYQSSNSKRELLIEALMGRPNREIHMIKDAFRDKRYNDDLQRCMEKELRADKFRAAVLLTLDERRQEENDVRPEYVQRDVEIWAKSLRRGGGESATLEICINRSDKHLRECLRLFEKQEGGNFAKLVLERSQNLVGEVIVHILNGVINRPARDAMLLHHALIDLKKKPRRESNSDRDNSPRSSKSRLNPFSDSQAQKEAAREKAKEAQDRKERYELLISRLVRLHWDRVHLRRVKEEYRIKFKAPVEHDVEDYVKEGEFQEFCFGLLDTK